MFNHTIVTFIHKRNLCNHSIIILFTSLLSVYFEDMVVSHLLHNMHIRQTPQICSVISVEK
jgi:uncharacterized membrane protein